MSSVRGVTLPELLIVLGLLALVIGTAGMASLSDFSKTTERTDRDVLTDALTTARARAQSNVCNHATCSVPLSHGVYVMNDAFVMFEGPAYQARHPASDIFLPRAGTASIHGAREFVFNPGSGSAAVGGTIEIGDDSIYVIVVHPSGNISTVVSSS